MTPITALRFTIGLAALVATAIAIAASVEEKKGDIYYIPDKGEAHQLTTSGRDKSPILSPDGKTIVFARTRSDNDPEYADDLWLMDASGKNQRVAVKGRDARNPEDILSFIRPETFSSDGKLLYFMSAAWATSGAVHVLDLKSGKTRFVTDGLRFWLTQSAKYPGYLVVMKHEHLAEGDIRDSYWLVSPTGEEVMPMGGSEEQMTEPVRSGEKH